MAVAAAIAYAVGCETQSLCLYLRIYQGPVRIRILSTYYHHGDIVVAPMIQRHFYERLGGCIKVATAGQCGCNRIILDFIA